MKAGQQVTPTLRLTRLLGKGGMGSVWLADHLTLGSQVAIKFMAIANIDDETLMQRFRTEAKAAAQIKHPHVAQVFDHGVTADDGVPYIVMEYLEGEDLKHAVKRLGPLPIADVVRVVTHAAKALARAHTLGIVHRDIKPDNIFMCNIDGETFVKLLDFGVAKIDQGNAMAGATTTGSMMGTPLYMSPEQLLSARSVDLRSDLWSLAVVAYFALTGRVPFTGETIGSLSVAVHGGVFPLPSTLRPELPPALDAWFVRTLKRDPNERFQSAKEMAEAFDKASSSHAMSTHAALSSSTPSMHPSFASMAQMPSSPALSQSSPVSSESSSMMAIPQPTFAGTASDAGRPGATKRQLYVAVGASAGAVLTLGIIVIALVLGGSTSSEDKPSAATQPDQPIVKPIAAIPATTTETTVASAAPSAAFADKPTSDKRISDKPQGKTASSPTPPPPPAKTGAAKPPPKDTIGF